MTELTDDLRSEVERQHRIIEALEIQIKAQSESLKRYRAQDRMNPKGTK